MICSECGRKHIGSKDIKPDQKEDEVTKHRYNSVIDMIINLHKDEVDELEAENAKLKEVLEELRVAGLHEVGCGITAKCNCKVRGRLAPAMYQASQLAAKHTKDEKEARGAGREALADYLSKHSKEITHESH